MHLNQPSAHVNHSLSGGDDHNGEPLPKGLLTESQRIVAMLRQADRLQNHVDLEGWDSPRGDALKNLMLEGLKLLLTKALPPPPEGE